MKKTNFSYYIVTLVIFAILFNVTSLFAEDEASLEAPPSIEDISKDQNKLQLKTETVYESKLFPGVRLCEKEEVDYRGNFRKVNCQDEEIIKAVSTRDVDPYNTKPDRIVNDRVEPNGNIFRIDFRRKATVVEPTAESTEEY